MREASRTAAANTIASYKLMLDAGKLEGGEDAYKNLENEITAAYEKQAVEATNTAISEGLRAIREVYGDELEETAKQLNKDLKGIFSINPNNMNQNMEELQNVIEQSMSKVNISSGVKKSIKGYLEKLAPTADELKKMALKDQSLWKIYGDTLTSVEALKTLSGSGKQMGNAVLSGANSSGVLADAEKAGQAIKESIIKPFSQTTTVKVPLDIYIQSNTKGYLPGSGRETISAPNSDVTYTTEKPENMPKSINEQGKTDNSIGGKISRAWNSIAKNAMETANVDSNAMGTPYFGGGLTYINERGGEIVDLPAGSRIYPADKSEKMMKSTPNINVSVNVEGNIIGAESTAELIGSIVCKRIVSTVNAM